MTSRLSSLLVQDGLVSAKRMADAFQRQVIYGGTLDTNLLEMRVVEEEMLLTYLGRASGLPTQPAGISAMGKPTPKMLEAFPQGVSERFRAVPGDSVDGGVLRVLVADPVEPQDLEALAQTVRARIEPWICPEFRIVEAMDVVYGVPMPPRFVRLLTRSKQSFEGKVPLAPRLIDPVPRFGNLHEFRLEQSMPGIPASTIDAALLGQPPYEEPGESVDESTVVEEYPVSAGPVPELIPEQSAPVMPVKISAPVVAEEPPPPPKPQPIAVQRPPAPVPQAQEPVPQGGRKKKKRRGEASKVPPPAPIIARPVIIPPGRSEARNEAPPAQPRASAEPKVVIEPSVVITDLPSEVSTRSGEWPEVRPQEMPSPPGGIPIEQEGAQPVVLRLGQELTPLPTPAPPPSEFSGPNSSLVSGLHGVLATPPVRPPIEAPLSDPIPVPIDSGRLGEQIVHGRPGLTTPSNPPKAKEPPRVAVALGEARPTPLSFEAARELITGAEERDLIFEALCRAVRGRAAFAAVFTVHGDVAFGRTALHDEWLDRQALGKVAVPLDRPSPFRIAVKGRAPYVGRIGEQPAVGDPLSAIGRRPPLNAAVLPVLVRGRPVALLYLDDDGRELKAGLIEELKPLVVEVSQAFQRLVLRSKAGGFATPEEAARDRRGRIQDEMMAPNTSAWRSPEAREKERDKRGHKTLARFSTQGETPRVVEVRDLPKAPSDIATPKESTEQPTNRLRVDGPRKDSKPGVAPDKGKDRRPQESKPEARPESQQKTEAPAIARAPEPTPASREQKPARTEEPRRKPEAAPATPAELVAKAAGGEEKGVEQLLAGGEEAARALVAALPGPLKSRERQALGDPIGEPVFARGSLLALVPRLGMTVVDPLLQRLGDPTTPPDVRYYLTLCFTELPVQQALGPLSERVFDADDAVRMAAVTALRNYPPSTELRDLLETLRSELLGPEAKRQLQAAEALGELRDVQAVPRLIQLLGHSDLLLSDAAAKALQTLTKQDFGRSRMRWRWWWRSHQEQPRLQWMLAGLNHHSAPVRASAQDELRGLCGDVAGYRFDLPRREREAAQRRWIEWWQRRGYPVQAL